MELVMAETHLTLILMPDTFAICRLAASAASPAWAAAGAFSAVVRTPEELSIVCIEQAAPPDVACQRGWRGLQVGGPLDFALIGVLAGLAVPLAEAGVSIFVVSTYDTDYLFVREQQLGAAVSALRCAGHAVA
jgi:hypothetical protein